MTTEPRRLLFLCPHNAAKSVLAAAYCRKLAAQRNIAVHVDSAGTHPGPVVSPLVIKAVQAEGIDVSDYQPRRVTQDEVGAAWRVVSLGCPPDDLPQPAGAVEYWDDVPPPSQDLALTRAVIIEHINRLLDELDPDQWRDPPKSGM